MTSLTAGTVETSFQKSKHIRIGGGGGQRIFVLSFIDFYVFSADMMNK